MALRKAAGRAMARRRCGKAAVVLVACVQRTTDASMRAVRPRRRRRSSARSRTYRRKGRRILFGWVRESRPRDEYVVAGWSGAFALPRVLAPDEPLTVRVFVDRSVIEVFAHGRVCKTIRTYHQPGDNLNLLRLIARGGATGVESLDVWEMGAFAP